MESEKLNHINKYMNKSELETLSKSQLIEMLLMRTKPVTAPRTYKPRPAPRKGVKQMVQTYENTIIPPPLEFSDNPVPAPRTYKPRPPVPAPRKGVKQMVQEYESNIIPPPLEFSDNPIPAPRTYKPRPPVPAPRIKIKQVDKALKGYTKSYKISIKNNEDPLVQLQNTRKTVEYHIIKILRLFKGLKFVETLKVTFNKLSDGEIVFRTAYFSSTYETIINNIDINKSLSISEQEIINKIAQWVSVGSGWTIQSVDNHYLNVVKYQPMRGSSYIELPTELRNKGLINMKNIDNECFRWCHIRHLNPQDKYPQRIKKSDKEYIKELDHSGVDFPVTTKQYNKIEKQNNIRIHVIGYEDGQPYPIYVSKEKFEDHIELSLITKDENKHYVFIKDFNKFMYRQTKHKERKHFCIYCLQCFSSERVLNDHIENCIMVNGKQAIKMRNKGNNILKFNNFHKQ